MIVIQDNLLNKNECEELILMYSTHSDKSIEWYGSHPLKLNNLSDEDLFFSKQILNMISNFAVSVFGSNLYVERADITKWPAGSDKDYHHDDARDSTFLSSITYLNDDYDGGETFFENKLLIIPEIGKTIFFDGKKYLHGVKKVSKNPRYTIAIWYTNDVNQLIRW